jgi:hypothetical protein
MTRFDQGMDLSTWNIASTDYNRLNKLTKTSSEAFFYQARRHSKVIFLTDNVELV